MIRRTFIERALRQIYGDQPSDDANISVNLVNTWLDAAIAIAAKANHTDNLKLDGIAYVNGSFYTTYKGLPITQDENFLWKVTLPHLPFGLGTNEGINTAQIKENSVNISKPLTFMNQAQKSWHEGMRDIPNKILAYSEGGFIFIISTIILSQYTASVTMISGGDSTDLDSTLNVPSDYHPIMIDYINQQLMKQRSVPQDVVNDGVDNPVTKTV